MTIETVAKSAERQLQVVSLSKRSLADYYGRWWPILNVYFVIMFFAALLSWAVVDVYGENSFILGLMFVSSKQPTPDAVVGVISILIGGAVAAFIWAYNDTKDRFVWVELARSEVDAVLSLIDSQLVASSGQTSVGFFVPAGIADGFNANSQKFAYLNFRALRAMRFFFLGLSNFRMDDCVGRPADILGTDELRDLRYLAVLQGVLAARILGSRQSCHVRLVENLYERVSSSSLDVCQQCAMDLRRYFLITDR